MKSSLQKNFAIAFYRYRMWLEEQAVPAPERNILLRQANHFLAYLTLSGSDFSSALKKPAAWQNALRAYRRFLRCSMNRDPVRVDRALACVQKFCDFSALSAKATARPAVSSETALKRERATKTAIWPGRIEPKLGSDSKIIVEPGRSGAGRSTTRPSF